MICNDVSNKPLMSCQLDLLTADKCLFGIVVANFLTVSINHFNSSLIVYLTPYLKKS